MSKVSNEPTQAVDILDQMDDNEPDNKKIIDKLKHSHHEGYELDKYELIAIQQALETWDVLSVKCTKILLVKIMLGTNFLLNRSLEVMNLMLERGCCKSFDDVSNPQECATLLAKGSCDK